MNKKQIKIINVFLSILILAQFILPYNFGSISFAADEDVYDVILFWGQSNMQGCCTPVAETRYNPADPSSISEYSRTSMIDQDILACLGSMYGTTLRNYMAIPQVSNTVFEYMYTTNSLQEINSSTWALGEDLMVNSDGSLSTTDNTNIKALYSSFGTNMIPEFCRTYYQRTGHKVVAVFAANPGKEIRNFLPYNDPDNNVSADYKALKLYEAIQEKYTSAINYLNSHNLKIGIQAHVVFQGEADMAAYHTDYEQMFMKLHNYFKGLGMQKGVVVETSMQAGSMLMSQIDLFKNQQDSLIANNADIILGSSFPYDRYVPPQIDYDNCNTKICYYNNSKLSYTEAFTRATQSEDYGGENALHYSSAGLSQVGRDCANSLADVLDSTPPTLSVSYSTTLKTNKDVTATITANEEIQGVSGWTLSSNKKQLTKKFTANGAEQVTVLDTFGNSATITVMVANIDKTAPTANIVLSTSSITNQNVTATITANEEIQQVSGWTLSSNNKVLTKVFSSNGSENVTLVDLAGNSATVMVVVANIDKVAPTATVSYSTTSQTRQNVTATIAANEQIQEVSGWTRSSDNKSLTKSFSANTTTQVTIVDLAGNSSTVPISIANIDKTGPTATVSYSTTNPTNQNVTVTISCDEAIQPLIGWSNASIGRVWTKSYSANTSEQVTIRDEAGNSTILNISISNIDKVAPTATVSYSTTLLTNQDVIVTIAANEQIQELSGWTRSSDNKSLTKTYTANTTEQVTISDLAGNSYKANVTISNIDKVAPTATVRYSTTEPVNATVMVTINSNESIQAVDGWSLSQDQKSLTKGFSENATETVTIYDLAGNSSEINVTVANIDKNIPSADVNYSITKPTNQNVVVTITTNKPIKDVPGWNMSSDKQTLTKEFDTNASEKVRIEDLTLNNYQIIDVIVTNIDKYAPRITVEYSMTDPTKGPVTATIKSSEAIQQIEGWSISDDKTKLTKSYQANASESVTVYDLAGNSSPISINIDNIDTESPIAIVNYSTTLNTNKDVTVSITSNEALQKLDGWTLSNDNLVLTKKYSTNKTETVTVSDTAGNTSNVEVSVSNIDKVAPNAEVVYSVKTITKNFVIAVITSNEALQQSDGWFLSSDKLNLSKTFSKNAKEEVIIRDLAGNEKKVTVNVSNIDTEAPVSTIKYSTTAQTNQSVTVQITAKEPLQSLAGWTLSSDSKTLSKLFTENTKEDVVILDAAGNSYKQTINITNIDKKAPTIKVSYKTGVGSTNEVVVTLTSNESIKQIECWTLLEDGKSLVKIYSQSKAENIDVYDLAGNKTTIKIDTQKMESTTISGSESGDKPSSQTPSQSQTGSPQSGDNTVYQGVLPKTGFAYVLPFMIIGISILSIVLYVKKKEYDY